MLILVIGLPVRNKNRDLNSGLFLNNYCYSRIETQKYIQDD